MFSFRSFLLVLLSSILLASCSLSSAASTPAVRYERPWPEVVAEAYRLADEAGLLDAHIATVRLEYATAEVPNYMAERADYYVFSFMGSEDLQRIKVDLYSSEKPTSAFNPLSDQELAALQTGRSDDPVHRIRTSPSMLFEQVGPLLSEFHAKSPMKIPPIIAALVASNDREADVVWKIIASNDEAMLYISVNAETGELISHEVEEIE
jgi:hypothetical protein